MNKFFVRLLNVYLKNPQLCYSLKITCIQKFIFSEIHFQKFIFPKITKKRWVRLRLPQKFFLKTQSHYSALKVTGNRK